MKANGGADRARSQPAKGGLLARRLIFVLAVGLFALAVNDLVGQWVLYSEALCRLIFY
jgi:hypothetical protein